MKDFYYILGTDVNATSAEIREAYKKLSKKFHPDLNQNDYYFESRFKEVSEAYETLNDPHKRSRYDAAFKRSGSQVDTGNKKISPKVKAKHIDIAFSIMLVLLTFVFGYYVVRSIRGVKTTKINTSIASAAPKLHKKKKKHNLKAKPINSINEVIAQTSSSSKITSIPQNAHLAAPVAVNTTQVNNKVTVNPVKPQIKAPVIANVKTDVKPHVDNSAAYIPDFLYTASIKPNVTGVVYMRKVDNYNSDVVNVIPGNSKVFVLEEGNVFCKIRFNSKTGYVPRWTIQTQ